MAELLILNVVVDGNNVASVSLAEPFAGWAKRSKDSDGARPTSRYLLFHIPVVLEKKVYLVHNGRFAKGYEKVVVREVGVRSDDRENEDAGVLAR
jgi:hypothetical protein